MNYKLVENISWRKIDNQVLILDSRINKQAHELNPIASFIWLKIDQGHQKSDIYQSLCDYYPSENEDQLLNDIDQFIHNMLELGLFLESEA